MCAAVVFFGASWVISWVRAWPSAKQITQPGSLIVVSQPTLSWNQISPTRTPTLWKLASESAVGVLATHNLSTHSCSTQAWLTFSAGARTTLGWSLPPKPPTEQAEACSASLSPFQPDGVPAAGKTAPAHYPSWRIWRHAALKRVQPADLGRLGTSLPATGQCITAVGHDAGLGAADHTGEIAHYSPSIVDVDLTACPITFIGFSAPNDTDLANIMRRAPGDATIVVVGIADDNGPEVMHTVVIAGPGVRHGLLTSISTRQPGVLQTTDLSAWVLKRLGSKAPHLLEGRTPMVQLRPPGTNAITDASTLARQLSIEHGLVGTFLVRFLVTMAVLLAIGGFTWTLRRREVDAGPSRGLRLWFAMIGAVTASMPVATWLIVLFPGWRSSHIAVTLSCGIPAISVVIGTLAVVGPWRRWVFGSSAFIAAVTLVVILLDTMHGSSLQFSSIMGLQPVYGGRFFGMGNVGYALLATSALLVAAIFAGRLHEQGHRRLATLTVMLIGAFTLFVDGNPLWGSDGGGSLSMFPAFAYLTLSAAGLRLTWRRAVLIVGSSVAVAGSLAILDYLRPQQYRTHLGDFVAGLRDHGQLTGVERIWQANWTMLTSTWYTMLVPLILVLAVIVLVLPQYWPVRLIVSLVDRVPMLGQGLAAAMVCWLLGFLANDSGTSIPPTGMMLVAPLLILLATRLPLGPQSRRASIRGTFAHCESDEPPTRADIEN